MKLLLKLARVSLPKKIASFVFVSLCLTSWLAAEADWTVLVYAQAKNNLSNFAYKNFSDMAAVGSGKNLNILVQWYQPEQQGIWRYKVEKGKMILDVCLSNKTDGNQSRDLVDSMRWAVTKYPAKKYFLVLWNHGIGIIDPVWGNQSPWSPSSKFFTERWGMGKQHPIKLDSTPMKPQPIMLAQNNQMVFDQATMASLDQDYGVTSNHIHRGILFNEETKTYMSNQMLVRALADIKVSVLKNKKIDLLGMDACLMAMLEVGYLARDYANYMIASQEVELAYGWNYMAFLKLFSTGRLSQEQAAQSIVSSYQKFYKNKIQFYTQSAIDLSKMKLLRESLDHTVHALRGCAELNKPLMKETVKRARKACLQFSAASYIDLHSFFVELKKQVELVFEKQVKNKQRIFELKKCMLATNRLIEQAVIANASGTYLARAKGLSIYCPVSHIDGSYHMTEFAQDSVWLAFLKDLLQG